MERRSFIRSIVAGLGALVVGPALLIHGGPAQQPVDIAYVAFDQLEQWKFNEIVHITKELLKDSFDIRLIVPDYIRNELAKALERELR